METTRIENGSTEETAEKVFHPLSEALKTSNIAINYYEVPPGETIGDCYHRHHEQEEVFYIIAGTATFEIEQGNVVVEAGELVRVAPGEWQQGMNHEDSRLKVLALGAPREQGPTDLRRECPACDERTPVESESTNDELVYYCGVCGAETGRYSF